MMDDLVYFTHKMYFLLGNDALELVLILVVVG